jgi:peroxiredoxin
LSKLALSPAVLVVSLFLAGNVLGCTTRSGASSAPKSPTAIAVGATAPDFTGRDLDGAAFQLSKHLGKDVVLINFFATWCAPCLSEMPHLRAMYEANRGKGFTIVAVSLDGAQATADVRAFWRRNDFNFPAILDEDLHITAMYNPKKTAPLSLLIDRSGKVVALRDGYNAGDEALLAKDVASLLD